MKRLLLSIFTLGVCVSPAGLSTATTVRSLNLNELADQSQIIVKAEVISKQTANDPEESGMLVTYYTLKVLDSLKGGTTAGGELVIKQVAQGEYVSEGNRIRQNYYFPEYEVGKTYVFFLPPPHHRTGLLAPVGLFQGVFDVIKSGGQEVLPQLKARQKTLQARLGDKTKNSNLSRLLQATAADPSYENFKSAIESLK